MASILSSLKIVHAKKLINNTDPIQFRRTKMLRKLDQQIAIAQALLDGGEHQFNHTPRVLNADLGDVRDKETRLRTRKWWFVAENEKLVIQLRYGNRVLTFSKNRNAVEVTSTSELLSALQKLKLAVENGEMDNEIAVAADHLKHGFKTRKINNFKS